MYQNGLLFVATMVLSSSMALAVPLSLEERLSDFDQLNAGIQSSYGPLSYKRENKIVDFEALSANYRELVQQTTTNADFYYLVRRYIAEFHDGHFFAIVPSERMAFFPVQAELVEDKVLLDQVPSQLPPNMFPFKKGDEILAFNDRDIQTLLKELAGYFGNGNPRTELKNAAWMLFRRPGVLLPIPEESNFTLTVKRADTGQVETAHLFWLISGDFIDENESLLTTPPVWQNAPQLTAQPIDYLRLSDREKYEMMLGEDMLETTYKCSGTTRVQIPTDAVMLSEKPFVAYYHKTPKGNVGYLRIPHYSPDGDNAQAAMDKFFAQYEYVVHQLEKNTVGLIIDQDHNCGGYIALVERMLSLFMNEPVSPVQFQLLASKSDYLQYRSWLRFVDNLSLMKEQLQGVEQLLKTAWQNGEALTPKTSLLGQDSIYPNRVRYTKPIVMTIDEVSGSGGDAFPAMMQGYGRVKLLGTRTAGMGGHVGQLPPLHFSQINVQLTKSLFYRPDGVAVENHGASPNYPYTLTKDDFMNSYKGYQQFYLEKLLKEIPNENDVNSFFRMLVQ